MRLPICSRISAWTAERRTSRTIVAVVSLACLSVVSALGQDRANVTVDLGHTINVLTDTSLGLPGSMSDSNCFVETSIPYLRTAGITAVKFPGNRDVADLYHWSTGEATPYKGGDPGYIAPQCNFARFALFAEQLGQGVIVVNYGSNANGGGGGEPQEAAAWVAYTNGSAADTRALGKDSTGKDWQTVDYWATLRGQAPLAKDDGLNFLRIRHPRPFGFHLWQIGDEVYNNGYYGESHIGDPDLHAPAPANAKELGKLKGNPNLSPVAYAANFQRFAQAMKAVDPSIEVGAAFVMPPSPDPNSHDWAPDWDTEVLKHACADIDFVTFDWSLQPLMPPDWKTLDEATLLQNQGYNQRNVIDLLLEPILQEDKRYCPAGHLPRLAFAPAAIANWVEVKHPVAEALWADDFYALLVESGSVNINWSVMYGDSMLSANGSKPGPVFYGLQMLHIMAYRPGDLLVDARSNSLLLAAHATRRRDGIVGLMLINKDPHNSAEVKVTLQNGSVGSAGRRIDYGGAQFAAKSGLTVSSFSVPDKTFTVTIPPYTITDILLPERKEK